MGFFFTPFRISIFLILFLAPSFLSIAEKINPSKAKKSSAVEEKNTTKTACHMLPQKTVEDFWTISECYYEKNDILNTIDTLQKLTRRNPRETQAFFVASWLYFTLGQNQGGEEFDKHLLKALEELQRAKVNNPTHWEVYVELGDFYSLRLERHDRAYAEYVTARKYYDGDYANKVAPASNGRKAAIENRIARTAEYLDRKGEAVEASCFALYFDPDDKTALARIKKHNGSCVRKKVSDPSEKKEEKK